MTLQSFSTPEARWAALQSRDPQSSCAFIYCVTTTKIYCRPNCPSRLARRANIKFHNTAAEAAADGFRPCKRCRPSSKDSEGDPQILMAEKACQLIQKERGDAEKWAVKRLAKEVGLTESHFCRVFKKITGLTVGEYRMRIQEQPVKKVLTPMWMDFGKDDQTDPAFLGQDHGLTYDDPLEGAVLTNPLSSKLSQYWNIFSGSIALEQYKGLDDFNFSDYQFDPIESLPNFSTQQPSDDCFQFLDFDWPTSIGPQP